MPNLRIDFYGKIGYNRGSPHSPSKFIVGPLQGNFYREEQSIWPTKNCGE